MATETSPFSSVGEMLRTWQPGEPVYCIYPHVYRDTAKRFLRGIPGRVLYAVKANNHPAILGLLNQAGVVHFDCASSDMLPGDVDLPLDIRPGDYLEFGNIGAYSLSGRTDFNGHFSERFAEITSLDEMPPLL